MKELLRDFIEKRATPLVERHRRGQKPSSLLRTPGIRTPSGSRVKTLSYRFGQFGQQIQRVQDLDIRVKIVGGQQLVSNRIVHRKHAGQL